jgi:hypothetical protein
MAIKFVDQTNFDFIINCAGLGASKLCNDHNMQAVSGHLIKVKAPWIKHCLMLDYQLTCIHPMYINNLLIYTYIYILIKIYVYI